MVDKEDTVEVIYLVEEGASKRTFSFNTDRSAVFEEGLDTDFRRTGNEAVNFWDGETTFVILLELTVGFDDFWVEKSGEIAIFLVVEIVADDDDAAIEAELRGGHGGGKLKRMLLLPIERRLAHSGDNLGGLGGGAVDLATFLTQARVGGGDNFHMGKLYHKRLGGSRET